MERARKALEAEGVEQVLRAMNEERTAADHACAGNGNKRVVQDTDAGEIIGHERSSAEAGSNEQGSAAQHLAKARESLHKSGGWRGEPPTRLRRRHRHGVWLGHGHLLRLLRRFEMRDAFHTPAL